MIKFSWPTIFKLFNELTCFKYSLAWVNLTEWIFDQRLIISYLPNTFVRDWWVKYSCLYLNVFLSRPIIFFKASNCFVFMKEISLNLFSDTCSLSRLGNSCSNSSTIVSLSKWILLMDATFPYEMYDIFNSYLNITSNKVLKSALKYFKHFFRFSTLISLLDSSPLGLIFPSQQVLVNNQLDDASWYDYSYHFLWFWFSDNQLSSSVILNLDQLESQHLGKL